MADNSTLPVNGGGTEVFANDDIGGVKYWRSKLALGADGAAVDAVAGAGAVSTAVQRVTLASDDPAVTDLAAIEVLLGTIDADTGGALTALQIMDDWDESDRAKVNLIVGQAGIAAGSGNVGVTVPRVTLAGDDPAVANTSRLVSCASSIAPAAALATTAFQVSAQYNSTPPTFTNGQQGGLQIDASGALLASVKTLLTITSVTLSLDTSAYADGDVLADSQIVSACLRANDGTGTITNVTVIDEDDQGMGLDLIWLSANVALGTENAAPSITDANAREILGWVRVSASDFIDLGGVRLASVPCSIPVKGVTGADDLYVAAISRGTGTYTASGIVVRVAIACD